jgi:hypothetical protein
LDRIFIDFASGLGGFSKNFEVTALDFLVELFSFFFCLFGFVSFPGETTLAENNY